MLLIRRIAVAALNAQLNVVPRVFQSVNQRQVQKTLILKYLKLKGMKKVGKNTDKLLRGATLMGKKPQDFNFCADSLSLCAVSAVYVASF